MSLVEFDRYPDAALAHIVRGRLEAAGIQAFCFDTGMNTTESLMPLMFKVRVMVQAEELEDARRVIAEDDAASSAMEEDGDYDDEPFKGREPKDHRRRQRTLARFLAFMLLSPFLVLILGRCAGLLN